MKPYEQHSVVVLGSFNPRIFHPDWFRTNEILPEAEVDAAVTGEEGKGTLVITSEVTQIKFTSLLLKVEHERWELITERPDWAKDLGPIAASVFERLPHTPVKTVGLNVLNHLPLASSAELKAKIDRWLPLSALGAVVGEQPVLGAVVRAQWERFRILLTFEASKKFANGLFVNQNFERDLKGGATEMKSTLGEDWASVLDRAGKVLRTLTTDPS